MTAKRDLPWVEFEQVYAAELDYVRQRWQAVDDDLRRDLDVSEAPTAKNELVGLALSGGGIRSATFNLGLVQALYRKGVFDHVDYLSTVSGGGFLGSSISAAMRRGPEESEAAPRSRGAFPFLEFGPNGEVEDRESQFVAWQRSNCNYTETGGFLELARVTAVLWRGLLLNFLVLLPLLLALSVALVWWNGPNLARWEAADQKLAAAQSDAEQASAAAQRAEIWAIGGGVSARQAAEAARRSADAAARAAASLAVKASPIDLFPLSLWIAGLFVFMVLVFPVIVRVYKVYHHGEAEEESSVASRGLIEIVFAVLLALIVWGAAAESMPLLVRWFHHLEATGLRAGVTGAACIAALAALTLGSTTLPSLGGWRRWLGIPLVGLLGLVLPLTVMLYVADDLVYPVAGVGAEATALEPAFRVTTIEPMELARPSTEAGLVLLLPGVLLVILGGALGAAAAGKLRRSRVRGLLTMLATVLGALAGYAGLVGVSRSLALVSGVAGLEGIRPDLLVLAMAAVVHLFAWLSIDVNLTSVLNLYRDRLASAYLIGHRTRQYGDGVEYREVYVEPDLDLEELCGGDRGRSRVPYQILNTSLNLQGSRDPLLRDRRSDFLIFSKLYYGGPRTGYCETKRLKGVFPQIDLPTAMAISAATAAPNAALIRSKPLVALMILLNVRLGYWVPHPGRLSEWLQDKGIEMPRLADRWKWRIPAWTLAREMLSKVDEQHKFVNVSDGGHVENLGVYELLRRRCRYIICGDAEADPEHSFRALIRLQRLAWNNLSVKIDIARDDLKLAESGLSHRHWAVGTIHYPALRPGGEPETGHLLYVKPALTGNETDIIKEQRARSPEFPHEHSAGRHLEPEQFDAYRALGEHSIEDLFDGQSDTGPSELDFAGFGDGIENEPWMQDLFDGQSDTGPSELDFARFREAFEKLRPTARGVFICYRRVDTPAYSVLLQQGLRARFGEHRVFRDVVIKPGEVFTEKIQDELGKCKVVLVLIGSRWLGATADGKQRLFDPKDHVRNEIVTATRLGKKVIPLLLEQTPMPRENELPPELKPLVFQNAVHLSPDRFVRQLDELLRYLEVLLE